MPCGRFFHSAKAPFHQPPQHEKQACSFISFHKAKHCFSCIGRCIPMLLIFVRRKNTKNSLPCYASAQSTTSTLLFCSFHSVTPLSHSALPNHSVKGNHICLRSLLPFRCIPFQAFVPHDPSTPLHLHSISHLSRKSKSATHPCPIGYSSSILQN